MLDKPFVEEVCFCDVVNACGDLGEWSPLDSEICRTYYFNDVDIVIEEPVALMVSPSGDPPSCLRRREFLHCAYRLESYRVYRQARGTFLHFLRFIRHGKHLRDGDAELFCYQ